MTIETVEKIQRALERAGSPVLENGGQRGEAAKHKPTNCRSEAALPPSDKQRRGEWMSLIFARSWGQRLQHVCTELSPFAMKGIHAPVGQKLREGFQVGKHSCS